MAHKLFSTNKKVRSPVSTSIKATISFPGYIIWINFDGGKFQTWNINESTLLQEGEIE